jgi:hypothetical protein
MLQSGQFGSADAGALLGLVEFQPMQAEGGTVTAASPCISRHLPPSNGPPPGAVTHKDGIDEPLVLGNVPRAVPHE